MVDERRRRSPGVMDTAEAVFKPAAPKVEAPAKPPAIPGARETVSLRIDRDVLEHFQEQGPGWQDRLNATLRAAIWLSSD